MADLYAYLVSCQRNNAAYQVRYSKSLTRSCNEVLAIFYDMHAKFGVLDVIRK